MTQPTLPEQLVTIIARDTDEGGVELVGKHPQADLPNRYHDFRYPIRTTRQALHIAIHLLKWVLSQQGKR